MRTVVADTGICTGAHACRILISHVANSWETEKCCGKFSIRDNSAFFTSRKKLVAS